MPTPGPRRLCCRCHRAAACVGTTMMPRLLQYSTPSGRASSSSVKLCWRVWSGMLGLTHTARNYGRPWPTLAELTTVGVGRLLEADSDSGVVREFLRMFASETKQPRNDNRDSSRTVLAMNNESRHKTHNIQNGRAPGGCPQCVERDVHVVRRNVAEEHT